MSDEIKWWAYLHQNGTVQVKRWFGDPRDYTDDCKDNPFVIRVAYPFEAATREDAEKIAAAKLLEGGAP